MGGWSEKSCQLHVELPAKSALSPANNVGGVIIIRRLLSPRNGLGHSHGFGLGQWVVPVVWGWGVLAGELTKCLWHLQMRPASELMSHAQLASVSHEGVARSRVFHPKPGSVAPG